MARSRMVLSVCMSSAAAAAAAAAAAVDVWIGTGELGLITCRLREGSGEGEVVIKIKCEGLGKARFYARSDCLTLCGKSSRGLYLDDILLRPQGSFIPTPHHRIIPFSWNLMVS